MPLEESLMAQIHVNDHMIAEPVTAGGGNAGGRVEAGRVVLPSQQEISNKETFFSRHHKSSSMEKNPRHICCF